MAENVLPPSERLRELLAYCPDTGVLTWRRVRPGVARGRGDRSAESIANWWNGVFAETTAGSPQKDGRLRVTVDTVPYYAHRLAWSIFYGTPPDGTIDHLNGNPSDNRIANLRIASYAENSKNKVTTVRSSTGHRGVYLRHGRYRVLTRSLGRTITIGTFDALSEALEARRDFDAGHGFTARHLQSP